ncbi:lipid A-modifier LpxR family protein [Ruegeria sp. SCP11]|uniref:lipid A-modifier LpxR family protein n=1 Tax=Ruegeria sp. SCP11 TaxID=3141378 RepID=UPI0033377390
MKTFLAFLLISMPQFLYAQSAAAPTVAAKPDKRELVGFGWLFTDDLVGDDHDRWQTSSLNLSWILARGWNGDLPEAFGDVIEIRAYTQMISPEDLVNPSPTDRQYAGILSLGAYSHFQKRSAQYTVGAELVAVGPQTGVDSLQSEFHKLIGSTPPSKAVLDDQIPNDFYPTAVVEIGREWEFGRNTRFRPFVSLRAGDETLARVGMDVTIGQVGRSELLIRDKITGQRYRTMRTGPKGVSGIFGFDAAYVADSAYIPDSGTVSLKHERYRARLGFNWEAKYGTLFYGATYLSEEFDQQPESQVVGSINFKISF